MLCRFVNVSNVIAKSRGKVVVQWCGMLGGPGAEKGFVRLERSCEPMAGRVKSQCDGIGMLVCCIECVMQVHQKGVAAPTAAVLDIRVRELRAMEEVCGRDTDRMA